MYTKHFVTKQHRMIETIYYKSNFKSRSVRNHIKEEIWYSINRYKNIISLHTIKFVNIKTVIED